MAFLPNRAHDIPFAMVNSLSGAALTGASVTGYRSIDGGIQAAVSGSISELANGQYVFEGLAADFAAEQSVGFLFTASNAIPVHVLTQVKKFHRSTTYDLPFLLINTSNGQGLTGASVTGKRCLDGGAQEAVEGSITELGNGQYVFEATAADFGATDVVGFLFTATNAMPVHFAIDLERVFAETDTLEDSPASVLATYIVSLGHMTLPSSAGSWPIYVSHLPDGDNVEDDAGAIYDTTPLKDGRHMDGDIVQHFGVQLSIRAKTFDDGWDKINEIAAALDSVVRVTVTKGSTDYYLENISRGGVNPLGLETGTKRRFMFSANFLATMKQI